MSIWTTIVSKLKGITPFGNAPGVQVALYIMVAAFVIGMVTHCATAKGAELEVVTGSTVVRGPTGVLGMNLRFPGIIANYGTLNAGFDIIGQSNWCSGGRTGPECFNNNQAAVHVQAVAPLKFDFDLGIGVAKLQHKDNYNSGPINFSLSLEHPVWKKLWPNVFWRYQHFSCAGTCSPNEGRDMLLVAYRFN
jgi:hypothetical protein